MQKISLTILKNSGVLWNVSKNSIEKWLGEVMRFYIQKLWLLIFIPYEKRAALLKTGSRVDSITGWQDVPEVYCFFEFREHWLVCDVEWIPVTLLSLNVLTVFNITHHFLPPLSKGNWHMYGNCGLFKLWHHYVENRRSKNKKRSLKKKRWKVNWLLANS